MLNKTTTFSCHIYIINTVSSVCELIHIILVKKKGFNLPSVEKEDIKEEETD